ncbi:MAG: Uma2 family endonuclease, partial [Planctomycetes bacterium]|nr:Uma2 family endonuclease [Planctomycetota bacterium]
IEILPLPKTSHQLIVQYLSNLLLTFVSPRKLGTTLFAPLRVRLPHGAFREPDVVFMLAEHAGRIGEEFWDGADLVVEVVSDENRTHDLVTKRAEYAAAGIPEYWIIDPREQTITVLTLRSGRYEVHAESRPGQKAGSVLLPGFEVDTAAVFRAAGGG